MIYNLTNHAFASLLDTAISWAESSDPKGWKIRKLTTYEVNRNFKPEYLDDAHGLSLKGHVFDNSPCPTSMDYIEWLQIPVLQEYAAIIQRLYPTAKISSTHFMDDTGFMAWHSNQGESPEKPFRLYITYNDAKGSLFKYIPTGGSEVVVIEEPVGWYAKVFNVEEELLHCIKSGANRYSIGMRFSL